MADEIKPLMIYPRKFLSILLFVFHLTFFVGGVWMIIEGEMMGLIGVILGGLLGFVAAGILPGVAYLKLTADGFEVKNLFKKKFIAWKDVEGFSIEKISAGVFVVYYFTPEYAELHKDVRMPASPSGANGAIAFYPQGGVVNCLQTLEQWKNAHG